MIRNTIANVRNNNTYSLFLATAILAAYAVSLVPEINDSEPYPDYWANIIDMKMKCSYDLNTRGFLKYWMNCFSFQYLGNDRLIPIMASVVIVYLTYVLANLITKDRIIGLIAMGAMTQNPLLTMFDSSPTYDQVWVAFLLLSVVLFYKKPVLGIMVFPISIMFKILSVSYIPALIFHAVMEKRIKNRNGVILGLALLTLVGIVSVSVLGAGSQIGVYPERLLDGFLRIFESIWIIFPAVIGVIVLDRFFMPKTKPANKNIVLMWIAWILLTTPLLYLFTEKQLQFGYRFVPFATFFSIYIGIVMVQIGNFVLELRLRKQLLKH